MPAPRATLRGGVSHGENRYSPLCVFGADSFRANIEIPKGPTYNRHNYILNLKLYNPIQSIYFVDINSYEACIHL